MRTANRPNPLGVLGGKLRLARLAIFWERTWPALWPTVGVIGAFLALSLFDVWSAVPGWLHFACLVLFGLAVMFALAHAVRTVRAPSRIEARRRLELMSGVAHRPLTALEDDLATDRHDPAALALWEAHKERLARALTRLRVGWPRAGLLAVDPFGLRAVLALALFVGVLAAGLDAPRRLMAAVTPVLDGQFGAPPSLDAWIDPPTYTERPPLIVARADRPLDEVADGQVLAVPAGSTLLARLKNGGAAPAVVIDEEEHLFSAIDEENHQIEIIIDEGSRLAIRQGRREVAAWPIQVIPDLAPTVEMPEPPQRTERAALRLSYQARDDYGIDSLRAVFRRDGAAAPLVVDMVLPGIRPKSVDDATFRDLTAHPWAGLEVTLNFEAEDDIGQVGKSEPFVFVLPERVFVHPVARALVEQRKRLTVDPGAREQVAQALDAISASPELFQDDTVAFLAMRMARGRLLYDRSEDSIESVQSLLWDTALRIEDGQLSLAERNLRRLQQELMDALAGEASDEEIERLMNELQAAIDEFLRALAENARERAERGEPMAEIDPEAQMLDSDMLRDMVERMRELNRAGARDAAREMLAQLQNMLENLRAGRMPQNAGQMAGQQMLNDLSEIMRGQQQLLDETFRRSQQGQGQQGQQMPFGQQGQRGMPQGRGRQGEVPFSGPGSLSESQDGLRRQLGDLMRRLGESMGDIPTPLGRAELSMRSARDSLNMGEAGPATESQNDALDQLRQGAEAMLQQLQQQIGQDGQDGDAPFGRAGSADNDPFGRPLGGQWDLGDSVRVPDEGELQRSREILEELHRRSGERARPELELDYIDRLLRRF